MIKPEMIPQHVVEAAVKAEYEHHFRHSCKKWPEDCYEKERAVWRDNQRIAILAALNAWPGAELEIQLSKGCRMCITLPLPLTQDKP